MTAEVLRQAACSNCGCPRLLHPADIPGCESGCGCTFVFYPAEGGPVTSRPKGEA